MPVLIITRTREYRIDDVYLMIVGYFVGVISGKILLNVRKKQLHEVNQKNIQILRGGNLPVVFTSDDELSELILRCIEENVNYLVLSEEIKRFIFKQVKKEFTKQSVALTANTVRFMAYKV
jgi:hypothetical protein